MWKNREVKGMSHYKGNTYIYTDGACQGNGTDTESGTAGLL